LNENDNYRNYPILKAIEKNKIEIAKLLIEYANKNNIILELNYENINGVYPLLETIIKNNSEMVKLLMEYANKNRTILKLNEKDNDGNYPLFKFY